MAAHQITDAVIRAQADKQLGRDIESAVRLGLDSAPRHVELHNGDIYIEDPQTGHYLSDDELDALLAYIEAETGQAFADWCGPEDHRKPSRFSRLKRKRTK